MQIKKGRFISVFLSARRLHCAVNNTDLLSRMIAQTRAQSGENAPRENNVKLRCVLRAWVGGGELYVCALAHRSRTFGQTQRRRGVNFIVSTSAGWMDAPPCNARPYLGIHGAARCHGDAQRSVRAPTPLRALCRAIAPVRPFNAGLL